MSYKIIITGSTGMVGKGCLLECLDDNRVEEVLLINRSNIKINNPKIKELIIKDYSELINHKDQLSGYDACFHCMGVSSVGLSEEEYSKITFEATKTLIDILFDLTPNMTFNYVSGTGTDSSEKGKVMWARVKGKTENYLLNKGFKNAYAFRPGMIIPEKGIRSKTKLYDIIYQFTKPLFPILKSLNGITTTSKIGKVMVKSIDNNFNLKHLENIDINKFAKL